MKDGNAQITAMQAQFDETIAKLREDFTARLRVQKAANETTRKERSLGTSFDGQGDGGGLGASFAVCSSGYCTKIPRGMPSLRIRRLGATF